MGTRSIWKGPFISHSFFHEVLVSNKNILKTSSRNVVILDGHSLDPRVVIEDSKIRFRLKNSGFDEALGLEDEMISKKLTFRLFNKKSVNGEDVP